MDLVVHYDALVSAYHGMHSDALRLLKQHG
jgi:hypothetical protein